MFKTITKLLAPPVFTGDEEKTHIAQMLNVILLSVVIFLGGFIAIRVARGLDPVGIQNLSNVSLLLLMLVLLGVMRRGFVRAASLMLVTLSWANLMYQAWLFGGVRDSAFLAGIIIVLLANLLLGWRAGVAFAVLTIAAGWLMAYAESLGFIAFDLDEAPEVALELTLIFGLSSVFLALTTASLSSALKRARQSERSLWEGNRELQAMRQTLEQQVEARTRRLETVAALSERLSAILNQEELLAELVNQVKENFGYYHAHIYLLDDAQENLVVAAGTGQAGAEMKTRGHSIALHAPTSLVARAARTKQVVRVDNVRQEPDWLPNPLLPNTYSEMAVPIILEEQAVGVLDVQQDTVGGLDEGDAGLLRSLANQVAVAIRNAQVFNQVETALAEARAAQEHYMEQAWEKTRLLARGGQYHYAHVEAPPLDESAMAQAKKMALSQEQPSLVAVNGQQNQVSKVWASEANKVVVAPISVRSKNIGSLQLYPANQEHTWTEDDLAIVEAVVDQLAQTAETLRLFDETQERASREQTIREITEKLRQAPTLEALTRIAGQELSRALGVTHSVVKVGTTPVQESTQTQNGQD